VARAIARYEISLRTRDRGGPVAATMSGADWYTLALHRHILLLAHGFNNTADQARAAYDGLIAKLMPYLQRMGEGPDAIVGFQWPGDAAVGPFSSVDFLGYPIDIERARESADRLRGYVERLFDCSGPSLKFSIVGHSLGCRLALELLNSFVGKPSSFDVVALMAPAVPVDLVDPTYAGPAGPYLRLTDSVPRRTLKFHSSADMVLGIAFPAGQSLAFGMDIEAADYLEAVGFWGDPGTFGRSIAADGDAHGAYWTDDDVVFAIAAALDPTNRRLEARTLAPARPLAPPVRFGG